MQADRARRWVLATAAAALTSFALVYAAPTLAQDTSSAGIPQTADGHPDFTGVWQVLNTADWDIEAHSAQLGMPPGLGIVTDGPLPYREDAQKKRDANWEHRATEDVDTKCWLPGVPRAMYEPYPFQINQMPKQIIIVFQYANAKRNIYMDKPHPKGPLNFWMGDSRGTWDGDTLVVDVTYFNDDSMGQWLDRAGNYHSDALHVVERYHYIDKDHIDYSATLEDPTVYTRPFHIDMVLYRHIEKDFTILDDECYAFHDVDVGKPRVPWWRPAASN